MSVRPSRNQVQIPSRLKKLQNEVFGVDHGEDDYIPGPRPSTIWYQDSLYCFDWNRRLPTFWEAKCGSISEGLVYTRSDSTVLTLIEINLTVQCYGAGMQMRVETRPSPRSFRRLQALLIPWVRPRMRLSSLEGHWDKYGKELDHIPKKRIAFYGEEVAPPTKELIKRCWGWLF